MTPSVGKVSGPLVVIFGPTAVGKTALALEIAVALEGEIVSADSRLVYQGMDIGVAKPTPAEQALVPHHLLDMVTPGETLSLAAYQQAAYQTIDDILKRGKLPLLVGGTGQYISAVIEGWGIPEVAPNPQLRKELEEIASSQGVETLWKQLETHDPAAAANIHPNNVRRVVRALEVYLESGTPISELQKKTPPPYDVLQVGLSRSRTDLYTRIDTRIDQMLAQGLLEEVRGLMAAGYNRHTPAMSGLGYLQMMAYLEGHTSYQEAVEAIRRETRDFARRQDTWFRKYNKNAIWIEVAETPVATMIEIVRHWLESEHHDSTR